MGCYGMGVRRLLAVVAEEHHDDRGLIWPAASPPSRCTWRPWAPAGPPRSAEAADALHDRLVAAGVEVLYDDRDVSPGVKFADADLLGMPVRLVVGAKGVARGIVRVAVAGDRARSGNCRRRRRWRLWAGPDRRPDRARRSRPRSRRVLSQGPRPCLDCYTFQSAVRLGCSDADEAWAASPRFCFGRKHLRAGAQRRSGLSAVTVPRRRQQPHTGEEAAQMVQDLFAALRPVVGAAGLELVDVEMKSGVLLVTVDREGGVDLEALTDANRAVSGRARRARPDPGPVLARGLQPRGRAPAAHAGPLRQGGGCHRDGQDPAAGAGRAAPAGHAGGLRRCRVRAGRRRCAGGPSAWPTATSTGSARCSCGAPGAAARAGQAVRRRRTPGAASDRSRRRRGSRS